MGFAIFAFPLMGFCENSSLKCDGVQLFDVLPVDSVSVCVSVLV